MSVVGDANKKLVGFAESEIKARQGRNKTLTEETIPKLQATVQKAESMVEKKSLHAETILKNAQERIYKSRCAVIANEHAIAEMKLSVRMLESGDSLRETESLEDVEEWEAAARDEIEMYTRGNSITVKSNITYGY